MKYLVDTNVFLHKINTNIYRAATLCKEKNNNICVTRTIVDELEPCYYLEIEDESARGIYICVNNYISGKFKCINLIELSGVDGAKEELKKIRDRFYGWMRDPVYLEKLIEDGVLTREEIKKSNFRKRDLGECELIAIAKVSSDEYWLVSDDKGKVYKHPYNNIFDTYKDESGVKIITGTDWIEKIGFSL